MYSWLINMFLVQQPAFRDLGSLLNC